MLYYDKDVVPNMTLNGVLVGRIDTNTEFGEIDDNVSANYEIMQFTGLLDRKGKEIYEGDLLKNGIGCDPAEVIFKNGMFMAGIFGCTLEQYAGKNKEVIGNIYKNPELLGEKKQ